MDMGEAMQRDAARELRSDSAPPADPMWTYALAGTMAAALVGSAASDMVGMLCGLLSKCWKQAWAVSLWFASYLVAAGWSQIRLSPERSFVFAFLELDH